MTYKVFFAKSGITLEYDTVKHENLSLLDLAFDNDIKVRAGCRSGYCGTCQSVILEGEVKYFYDPPPVAPNKGTALLCSCYPVSDVTINC